MPELHVQQYAAEYNNRYKECVPEQRNTGHNIEQVQTNSDAAQ